MYASDEEEDENRLIVKATPEENNNYTSEIEDESEDDNDNDDEDEEMELLIKQQEENFKQIKSVVFNAAISFDMERSEYVKKNYLIVIDNIKIIPTTVKSDETEAEEEDVLVKFRGTLYHQGKVISESCMVYYSLLQMKLLSVQISIIPTSYKFKNDVPDDKNVPFIDVKFTDVVSELHSDNIDDVVTKHILPSIKPTITKRRNNKLGVPTKASNTKYKKWIPIDASLLKKMGKKATIYEFPSNAIQEELLSKFDDEKKLTSKYFDTIRSQYEGSKIQDERISNVTEKEIKERLEELSKFASFVSRDSKKAVEWVAFKTYPFGPHHDIYNYYCIGMCS